MYYQHVCHIISSVNEYTGGTATFVAKLTDQLCSEQISCHLLTLNYQHRGRQILPSRAKVYSYPAHFLTRHGRGFHPEANRVLHQLAATQLNIIHNHGLWMFPNLYARQVALKHDLPLVISPHGMLESWSLNRNQNQKRLAWLLYEHKNLVSASIFHATSINEAHSIRRLGFRQPIAVIPCGVDVPLDKHAVSRSVLIQRFPELSEKRWLLFLSRIHPKKGLENLLEVWHKISSQFPEWQLVLAGPVSTDIYQKDIEKLVDELELNQKVTFTGMITGELKASAISNADLFVLPTYSENFGIVIAEALAYGIPVITTQATPWQELEQHQCGWWIENTQQALTQSLTEGMQLSTEERSKMGQQGRSLIESRYSWQITSQQLADVYRWILKGGEPPDCIQFCDSGGNKA